MNGPTVFQATLTNTREQEGRGQQPRTPAPTRLPTTVRISRFELPRAVGPLDLEGTRRELRQIRRHCEKYTPAQLTPERDRS